LNSVKDDTHQDLDSKHRALNLATDAVRMRPRWSAGHVQVARCLEAIGSKHDLKGALAHYQRALELQPSLMEDIELQIKRLRAKVSRMACTMLYFLPDSVPIYDSVVVDCKGGQYSFCATKNGNIYVSNIRSGILVGEMEGHTDMVTTLSLSTDGQWLASGSLDSTVRIWNVQESIDALCGNHALKCYLVLEGHDNRVCDILFSGDGVSVVSASTDSTVKIWSIETGNCLYTLSGHSSLVSSISISHRSQMIASASGDAAFRLWNLQDGNCIENVQWESGPVVICDFVETSSSKQYLLTAHAQLVQQEARILLWDVIDRETGWVDGKLSAPKYAIDDLRGRPTSISTTSTDDSGCLLAACCSDGSVHVWDISDVPLKLISFNLDPDLEENQADLPPWRASSLKHAAHVHNIVEFLPGRGVLAAAGTRKNTLVVWDVDEGKQICSLHGHTRTIRKLCWVSMKLLLSCAEDGSVRLWDISQYLDDSIY
jgi:WD40 repeat protein